MIPTEVLLKFDRLGGVFLTVVITVSGDRCTGFDVMVTFFRRGLLTNRSVCCLCLMISLKIRNQKIC